MYLFYFFWFSLCKWMLLSFPAAVSNKHSHTWFLRSLRALIQSHFSSCLEVSGVNPPCCCASESLLLPQKASSPSFSRFLSPWTFQQMHLLNGMRMFWIMGTVFTGVLTNSDRILINKALACSCRIRWNEMYSSAVTGTYLCCEIQNGEEDKVSGRIKGEKSKRALIAGIAKYQTRKIWVFLCAKSRLSQRTGFYINGGF